MQRRQFLSAAAATAILPTALSKAIDPFKRSKPGKLRLSLAAYSMRKYLAPKPDEEHRIDLLGFVDFCKEQGIDGTELTSYYFPQEVTDDYLFNLRRHCHLMGMTISGGAIRNDFCSSDPKKVAADIAHTKKWIDYYAAIGAPAIRIFAGKEQKGEPIKKTLRRCARNCEKACKYAESRGIMLALENHGGVTAKAEDLLEIVKQVESPAFGVNFDSGNFRSTDAPYAELKMIAPYAVNAQIKVEIHQGEKNVPTDLERVTGILQNAGYSGWVALEYEASPEPYEAIPAWLDKLKPLMG